MNRRSILAALAVLPFCGGIAAALQARKSIPLMEARLMYQRTASAELLPALTLQQQVRELLMPNLRMINADNRDVEMDIKVVDSYLIVSALRQSNRAHLGFCITEREIRDRLYLTRFKPNCERLIRCVRQAIPPAPMAV